MLFVASVARLTDCVEFCSMIDIRLLSAVPAVIGEGSVALILYSTVSSDYTKGCCLWSNQTTVSCNRNFHKWFLGAGR